MGDTDTIKITAGIDVAKLLDDANKTLEAASAIGAAQGQEIPEKLTEEQKQQAVEAIKDPKIEIYTGKDDKIMRRMMLSLGLEDQGSSGTIAFDVSITGLNESQDIAEPADAQPFDQLLGQLGALGALGGAGGCRLRLGLGLRQRRRERRRRRRSGRLRGLLRVPHEGRRRRPEGARLRRPAGAVAGKSPLIKFR